MINHLNNNGACMLDFNVGKTYLKIGCFSLLITAFSVWLYNGTDVNLDMQLVMGCTAATLLLSFVSALLSFILSGFKLTIWLWANTALMSFTSIQLFYIFVKVIGIV